MRGGIAIGPTHDPADSECLLPANIPVEFRQCPYRTVAAPRMGLNRRRIGWNIGILGGDYSSDRSSSAIALPMASPTFMYVSALPP